MNRFPDGALQTNITAHWAIRTHGIANSLNPLDHPWNFHSATVAKHRLRAVTRADRQACGDGKWALVKPAFHTPGLTAVAVNLMCFLGYDRAVRIIRSSRARYRWEWRR